MDASWCAYLLERVRTINNLCFLPSAMNFWCDLMYEPMIHILLFAILWDHTLISSKPLLFAWRLLGLIVLNTSVNARCESNLTKLLLIFPMHVIRISTLFSVTALVIAYSQEIQATQRKFTSKLLNNFQSEKLLQNMNALCGTFRWIQKSSTGAIPYSGLK